jgi:DNA-binding NarL/FixJ family response regulator
MRPATPALEMSDGQREMLTELSKSRAAPFREVQRAQTLLLAADGLANYRIGEQVRVSPATVAA